MSNINEETTNITNSVMQLIGREFDKMGKGGAFHATFHGNKSLVEKAVANVLAAHYDPSQMEVPSYKLTTQELTRNGFQKDNSSISTRTRNVYKKRMVLSGKTVDVSVIHNIDDSFDLVFWYGDSQRISDVTTSTPAQIRSLVQEEIFANE